MPSSYPRKVSARVLTLSLVFAVAMVMGPGPGVYLVNPGADDPVDARFFLGLPVVYFWALLWYAVMACVVVVAYFTVWNKETETPTDA